MGREIRRVPPNWQHPKKEFPDARRGRMVERYQPMFDWPFGPKMDEWYAEWKSWENGTHPDREKFDGPFWEWSGGPPDPEYHRPDWPEGTATWFQVYETVSEGTPVTPPFATAEELVEYLVAHGDFWDQERVKEGWQATAPWQRDHAEAFVGRGWAMSGVMLGGKMYAPRDGMPESN